MVAKVFRVTIDHLRQAPGKHAFSYQGWSLSFDICDELRSLWPVLTSAKFGLFSVCRSDYLLTGTGDVRARLVGLLEQHGISVSNRDLVSATVATMPRFLGYVFNPVSFYLCKEGSQAIAIVFEVRNTFGQMQHYVCKLRSGEFPQTFMFPKIMYVSPFYDISGEYQIRVARFDDELDITVELHRPGEPHFSARIYGTGTPASRLSVLLAALRAPLFLPFVMVRIHLQAFRIFLSRAGKLVERPEKLGIGTITTGRSAWYAWRTWLVRVLSN